MIDKEEKEYFLAKSIEIAKDVNLEVLFDKNAKLEEMFECELRLVVKITEDQFCQRQFYCRYVNNDEMISIDQLMDLVVKNLEEIIKLVESVDSSINITPYFILEQPGLASASIEIRKDIKKTLQNITKYKLQPHIIDLYDSVLVKYKGTDTLQKRKLQKMIEAQEDALNFMRSGRRMI